MGEVKFEGTTKMEKEAGVWVDGHYVGYLKELKGNKKIMLLPGEHEISVRQSGYDDFVKKVDRGARSNADRQRRSAQKSACDGAGNYRHPEIEYRAEARRGISGRQICGPRQRIRRKISGPC